MKILKSIITYKIAVDIFMILLIIAIGFITLETILPNILSAYISPMILFFVTFAIIIVISLIAHTKNIYTQPKKTKKYLPALFIILFTVLIIITSLDYGYFFGVIIIVLSITIFSLLYSSLKQIFHKY